MSWFLRRVVAGLAFMALGGLAGLLMGPGQAAVPGIFIGGLLAITLIVVRDRVRVRRLLDWLRRGAEGAAPRDPGLWGELAYRIERVLRRSDQASRQERERLSQFLSAIEASPNGVLLLDAGHHIQWCNRRAAEHFGLDPQRDLQQRLTNLVRAPAFVSYLQTGDYDEPVTFAAPRGRGTVAVRVRPYGQDLKLLLSEDTTERERIDGMRRDFVANVSHEIRTPLTVLSGHLETLSQLPLSEAERDSVLATMRQQAQRMESLVGDLLTLAQLEGAARPPADRWVPVATLFAAARTDAESLSASRHTLRFSDSGAAEIAGSQAELLSALSNLVHNAVRYTPEGGEVDVSWRLRADGSAELVVADTGPGIAHEHLPRLTERFYRVDRSRSRATGGTGLGLSIVKHVAERHGGELHIQSEIGRGSTFRLLLPAVRVREHRANSAAPALRDEATNVAGVSAP